MDEEHRTPNGAYKVGLANWLPKSAAQCVAIDTFKRSPLVASVEDSSVHSTLVDLKREEVSIQTCLGGDQWRSMGTACAFGHLGCVKDMNPRHTCRVAQHVLKHMVSLLVWSLGKVG